MKQIRNDSCCVRINAHSINTEQLRLYAEGEIIRGGAKYICNGKAFVSAKSGIASDATSQELQFVQRNGTLRSKIDAGYRSNFSQRLSIRFHSHRDMKYYIYSFVWFYDCSMHISVMFDSSWLYVYAHNLANTVHSEQCTHFA
jgi:hypothetical protein